MNDKQKQIEEMVEIMCDDFGASFFAEKLYNASYRKQSEVIDEFVERLKEENEISLRRYGKGIGMTAIFRIADEMKFELFKQQEDNNG